MPETCLRATRAASSRVYLTGNQGRAQKDALQINPSRREVYFKIVYYGPGLSGKTTNIEVIHKRAPESKKGQLTSIATEGERTLFFDYMPLDLGRVGGLTAKLHLYTVPGQKFYDATRKLVLAGVDGVVFVADSQPQKMAENVDSLKNLEKHLADQGVSISGSPGAEPSRTIPVVIQWNKRDLPDALPVEDLELKLNRWSCPTFEAVAVTGDGVFPTLKKLSQLVLEKLARENNVKVTPPKVTPPAKPVPEQRPVPRQLPAGSPAPQPKRPSSSRAPTVVPLPAVRPSSSLVNQQPPLPTSPRASRGGESPARSAGGGAGEPRRSLRQALKKLLDFILHRH